MNKQQAQDYSPVIEAVNIMQAVVENNPKGGFKKPNLRAIAFIRKHGENPEWKPSWVKSLDEAIATTPGVYND